MNYLLVLMATILLAFEFALSKKYQAKDGANLTSGLKFNLLSGLVKAGIFFALSGFKLQFSAFSIICAAAMSVCAMAYSIIGFKILKLGDTSTYSVFLMCGGMLLPYFYGVLFLNEKISVLRILGVLIIICAVILSANAKFKFNLPFLLLCVAVFVLNGCVSIISKFHQINPTFSPVDSTVFVMYTGIFNFLISAVLLCFNKGSRKKPFLNKKSVGLIVIIAAVSGLSYMLQLIGAKNLPATVLYPMVTGGSIIFSSLAGVALFKEKLSKFQIISITLCFLGTLLFL